MRLRFKCLKNLFRKKPEIIKIIEPKKLISEEELKQLEADIKKIFPSMIRHGSTKRGRRAYGRIISYPATWKHREGLSWLLDDKEK